MENEFTYSSGKATANAGIAGSQIFEANLDSNTKGGSRQAPAQTPAGRGR